MKKCRLSRQTAAVLLALVFMVQNFGTAPVFAAGKFYYNLNYNESLRISNNSQVEIKNPIIIEDKSEVLDTRDLHTFSTESCNIGETITNWGEAPYRIIGYTFDGWWDGDYTDNRNAKRFEPDTVVTEELLNGRDTLSFYGHWTQYASPDISSGSLRLSASNARFEHLPDVVISDADGNEGLNSEVTDYTAEVYGDTEYLTLDFEQYEPDAETTVTLSNDELTDAPVELDSSKRKEITTDNAYIIDYTDGSTFYKQNNTVTGIRLGTPDNAVQLKDGENIIKITVTLPEVEPGGDISGNLSGNDGNIGRNIKTYTITVTRLRRQLHPNYGNSPYGDILGDIHDVDEEKAQKTELFDKTYTYNNVSGRVYSPNAWNMNGIRTTEILKGNTPEDTEYINYDKDDTALFVYAGSCFTDPGVTITGEDGNTVDISALGDRESLTRTIHYGDSNPEAALNGSEGENIIALPKNIKPGRYTIDYVYSYSGGEIIASRNMFVIPKPGDLNTDGYVNSLDWLETLNPPSLDTDDNCLYYFRGFDVTRDGTVDELDYSRIQSRGNMLPFYTDLSIEESEEPTEYTPSGDKDKLNMLYLGKEGTNPEEYELKTEDVFWIGYKLSDLSKSQAVFNNPVYSMTLGVDYDSRYISPADNWKENAETVFSDYELSGITDASREYTVNNSTASHTWSTTNIKKDIKTAVLDIYSTSEIPSRTLTDGEDDYIVKIPFKVTNIPPAGRSVISTHLDANTLSISFGAKGTLNRAMWDTSDSLNNSTNNLMDILNYNGDVTPKFSEEPVTDLTPDNHLIYGESVNIARSDLFGGGSLDDELPEGLNYSPTTNLIDGKPKEIGEHFFHIGGKLFKVTVDKATIRAVADNKEKTYGEANPELTFKYEGFKFEDGANAESVSRVIENAPTLSCAASQTTQCGDTAETAIVFDRESGKSDFYEFDYTDAALTINPKPIKVNITNIPVRTSAMVNSGVFTIPAEATNSEGGGFTSSDIINGDSVKISYNVTYPDDSAPGSKTVSISAPTVKYDEAGFERGKNYTVREYNETGAGGEVSNEVISSIFIRENCTLIYEYGQKIDLDSGKVHIEYDSTRTEDVTFAEAQRRGISIRYENTGAEVKPDDIMRVKGYGNVQGHNDTRLILDIPENPDISQLKTSKITVNKKKLHLIADDKERYYGDENSTCHSDGMTTTGFTYYFNNDDFVNGDSATVTDGVLTASSEGFTGFEAPQFICEAQPSTKIDKTAGYTEVPIVLSGGSSDNYEIVCENAVLTINKRPVTVTVTGGVPALTANYYFGKTAPFKVPALAFAGDAEDGTAASMTVNGLFNNDPVKVTYNAQYANSTPTDSTSITVADMALDNDYGESYNYTVSDWTNTAPGGRVYARNITTMEITEQPTLSYTYGEPLNINTGTVHIEYDSGEEYDVTFKEAVNTHKAVLTYTDTGKNVINQTHLIVADTGRTMTLTPPPTIYDVEAVETGAFDINKFEMSVSADNTNSTYGEETPEFTYTYEKTFPYGETEDVFEKKPSFVCNEDDGLTNVNQKTYSGVYTLYVGGAEADNYSFVYTEGRYTVFQKPLIVTEIANIDKLSSSDAFNSTNLSKDYDIKTDVNTDTLTFADGYAPLWDDFVEIKYTVTYPDTSKMGETDVDISNTELVKSYGSARNYYLQYIRTPQKGSIDKALITNIKITADPSKTAKTVDLNDGNGPQTVYEPRQYRYGDELDLSEEAFKVEITFDSGRIDKGVTFDKLSDYGITATYAGTSDTVADNNEFLTIDYHDGKKILLTPPSDAVMESSEPVETGALSVGKRTMHVIVNPASYTYGNSPENSIYTLSYDTNDFAPGESAPTAFGSPFTAPTLKCEINGAAADNKTGAGTYENVISASGGECHNYEFVCDSTNNLTVNKRGLKINRITGGIPDLTAADVYNHDGEVTAQNPVKLSAEADNFTKNNLALENLVNNDKIEITYKAVYTRSSQSETEPVGIEDVAFKDDCESKNNYDIIAAPTDSTGRILTRLISKIVVKENPAKMEYTYGEWFRLEGGKVDIEYNSGYVDEDITFDNLNNFGIAITFVKTDSNGAEIAGKEVRPNTLLTVPEHNGARIKLTVIEVPDRDTAVEGIQSAYTGPLTVYKKTMRIIGEDASMTYGDDAPAQPYAWHYNASDLVNGDSLTSSRFTDGLTAPAVSCLANSTTPAGKYSYITPGGGGSANYIFDYVPGTLTINKKDLRITAIIDGIPELTSELAYLNGFTPPIYLNGTAEYTQLKQQMELDGRINDDELGIVYKAKYTSIDVSQSDQTKSVTVGIEGVEFDKSHKRNDCYNIIETPSSATGGLVFKEQITNVEITDDPTLRDDNHQPIQYTYGDKLNLARGQVKVEYNSNHTEYFSFDELIEKTGGLIVPVYNDGTDEHIAYDGEILHASYHHGKRIKLKVTTAVPMTAEQLAKMQTAMLTVNRAVITATADNQTRYYGDENPELTFNYSGFVNGDDENSDNFKLNLTPPKAVCSAAVKSPVGMYDISFESGSSANYRFITVPAKLTVEKRALDIEDITGGIPSLTSKIIRDNPGAQEYVLHGEAVNTAGQLRLGNLSPGDAIRIEYDAVYTGNEDTRNAEVGISNIVLDETYGSGSNYVLRNKTDKSTCGNIYGKQISMVEITNQPKLEYIYGETLDLSEKGVRITYDDGEVISNIAFDELSKYGVEITYTDNYGNKTAAVSGAKLTVPGHSGMVLTLHPITALNNIDDAVSKPITVTKKALNVITAGATAIYGDDPTVDFAYDLQGFAYDDTKDSEEFKESFIEPSFKCMERDGVTPVSNTTGIGSYTIETEGAQSDNYRFVYSSGLLKINKRKLKITNITGSIPELTSDIIFAAPGGAHKLESEADNSLLRLENLVNDDKVKIKFNAVYTSEAPSDSCDVNIEYISIDNENYEIDNDSVRTVGGGKVHDREIVSVEITEQPVFNYTYGDVFKLSDGGGKVKITYDSGMIEENIPFTELSNHRVSVSYIESDGSSRPVADGERVTVPGFNGKKLKLTAKSAYDVEEAVTNVITVNKFMLEYGDPIVTPIVYNGNIKTTTGTVVFTNAQNGDNVTASADFTFDSELAGTGKTVYITNIRLNGNLSDNYELPSTELTAAGTIEKASIVPSLESEAVSLSETENTVTVNAPAMTAEQIKGGAKYEYSIDGGKTWHDSNVFEKLEYGTVCGVCVRFAETENYKQSEASPTVQLSTYTGKLTLTVKDEGTVLKSFCIRTDRVDSEESLRALIGDVGTTYYTCYSDAEGKVKLTYPLALNGDITIYTSLKKSSSSSGSGFAGGGKKPTPTPKATNVPEATPSTATDVTPTPTPKVTPRPADNLIPANRAYITGYEGEVTPSGLMMRAEVTKIISVISGKYNGNVKHKNSYSDVGEEFWYYNYIGFASKNGWVKGYLDGCFYPDNTITRAEFAAVIARYLEAEPAEGVKFNDTPKDAWSTGYITSLADMGILKGYLDGGFHPNDNITRAEGVTLINRVINRIPDKETIDKMECPFNDLEKSHWAYYEIMAAACEY